MEAKGTEALRSESEFMKKQLGRWVWNSTRLEKQSWLAQKMVDLKEKERIHL